MTEEIPSQNVHCEVGAQRGKAWLELSTKGVPPIKIALDAQAAFEMGESLARAAYTARYGTEPPSDTGYLHEQIRARVTEQMRDMLANRVSVMLNSLRHDPHYNNRRLAETLVDTILTKVA